jgi:hypothetical protein
MKFMILVKATKDSEAAGCRPKNLFAEMAAYHEELSKAGVLVDGLGLQRSEKGWRSSTTARSRTVIDGPVRRDEGARRRLHDHQRGSRAEALEWTKKFPNPSLDGGAAEIEVRQYFELEDFPQSPTLDRFRQIGIGE